MLQTTKLLTTFLIALTLAAITGCSSAQKSTSMDTMDTDDHSSADDDGLMGLMVNSDSDSGTAGPLKTVYFAYNSSVLNSEVRSMLDSNASFLQENPSVSLQIEGHCDERGGVQYNLALGEKRANAVRDYLIAMGVSSANISTISLGKERPIAFGNDESAWSQNRRANFVVTGK